MSAEWLSPGTVRTAECIKPEHVQAVERWQELKDYLGTQIDADDKVHRGFLAAGDLAGAAPFGGLLAANRNTLGKMQEMEQ